MNAQQYLDKKKSLQDIQSKLAVIRSNTTQVEEELSTLGVDPNNAQGHIHNVNKGIKTAEAELEKLITKFNDKYESTQDD